MKSHLKSRVALMAVLSFLGTGLAAQAADVDLKGAVSVAKTVSGLSAIACDDFAVGTYNPPACKTGQLCASLGSKIASASMSGTYSSGKCSYSIKVPEGKKVMVSSSPTAKAPKCSGTPGTVLLTSLSGPTGPFEISGLPNGVSLAADFKQTSQCVAPPK